MAPSRRRCGRARIRPVSPGGMRPPTLTMAPEARAAIERILARHPGRRVRIRHDGYG